MLAVPIAALAALFCLSAGSADVSVRVNTVPLRVPYGRSVIVNPRSTLAFQYPTNARCKVNVLRDNPLAERNGFLVPDAFPCDFQPGQVRYTHLGSKFHTQDFVKLQLRVDTEKKTEIIPFVLKVFVFFKPMEIVLKNLPIVVAEVGGLSTRIDQDVLSFAYNTESQFCHVALLRYGQQVPRYGDLLNVTVESSVGNRFECNDFTAADIRYSHRNLQSSNRDYIPLVVEISDKSLTVLKREYFQIIVRILGARVNERPTASFQASNTLQVQDHGVGAITSSILAAVDLETRDDEIIFNITKQLGPGEGQLISLDDPYRPLTAFYQKDIQDFKIAYRPPVIRDGKSRMFQVVLNAVDAEGAISDPILLLIMVKITNINAPIVIKNSGLDLFEGQARPLSTKHNLMVTDKDNLIDVKLQVIDGLQHGDLRIMGNSVRTFMATDLDFDVVKYHHDNSETYTDNIVFRLTDGTHSIQFVFPITIAPIDDQPPVLAYNTGLVLDEGGIARIDQHMLSAVDVDSDDLEIKFKIVTVPSSSTQNPARPARPGVLCLRTKSIPGKESNSWVLKPDGFYEKNTTEFTQQDLVDGRVFYRHLGGEVFRDQIQFVLFDNAAKSNVSPIQTFNIVINKVDDLEPRLFPGCTLIMSVDEFGRSVLNTSAIQYTDDDSKYTELTYTVTRAPYFADRINSSSAAGALVLVENGNTVSQFTQLELNHGKVEYEAPDVEIGVYPRHAQFVFSVSDAAGNVLQGQVVNIMLNPVDNKPPMVTVNQLEVNELNEAIIGRDVFSVRDQDTLLDEVHISFTRLPRYGVLLMDSTPIGTRESFTMDDVSALILSYEHTEPGEASDEAGLLVDDGVHKKVAMLEIVIVPRSHNMSSIVLNVTLKVKERSKETLKLPMSVDAPATSRQNSSAVRIVTPPRVGRILLDGVTCERFMVQDIMKGRVSYEHTGAETGIEGDQDHFNLAFVNKSFIMAGQLYKALEVMTLIVPVDNQPPEVKVQRPMTLREGEQAQLTLQHITITDPDTRERDVTCMIDVQPTSGFLENVLPSPGSEISNAGTRITSFTVRDIKQGNINYVQSNHAGTEPRIDWMAFSCTDTNNTSPRYLLNIIILPKNDEAPHLYYRDFTCREGAELVIDVTLLNAMDEDVPLDELMFHVVKAPEHGVITDTRLEGNIAVDTFTLTQIRKSTSIVYLHDGSETAKDSLQLAVSDGVHNTTRTIPIKILPVDDEQPRLTINNGLKLRASGESDVLTPQNLKATDVDSPDRNISFVMRVGPQAGVLQIMGVWGIRNISRGQGFTQTDISRRLIVYTHDKRIPTSRDEIRFDVTDGINTLLNQVFYIFIKDKDRIPPTVVNKGVTLKQGATVTITTDLLTAHDIGSPNTKLLYTLTKVPSQGHLELSDAPGIHITSFTQMDIASNKLVYVHTSSDESAGDNFDFEVTDGSSTTVTRKFLISLLNVDNKKPLAICSSLSVREGSSMIITPFEMRAEDQDTGPESLFFIVTRVPLHGMILKTGASVRRFSQSDVNNGLIAYLHDGSDTTSDSYFVSVSDGTHQDFYLSPHTSVPRNNPFEMKINITAVDNRPPQVVHNKGVTDLQVLTNGRLGVIFDENILKTEDRDSNNSALVYRIERQPLNGYLTKPSSSASTLSNFTQDDIDSTRVRYIVYPGLNVTSDIFTFSVSDPAGNVLPHQQFSIVWARISFSIRFYLVNETEGALYIKLRREGFLGDTSFVRMAMKGITAELHEDFSAFGTTHVQFSPGQTEAIWKLHILDDPKHETNETLELLLTNPRNCVVGARKHALVTIVDPEDLPTIQMVRARRVIEESFGQINVEMRRTGDVSTSLQVMCITRYKNEPGWALGTSPTSVMSFSDFIMRQEELSNVITLGKGETSKSCPVVVMDDSLYEEEEKFIVELKSHQGSHVNEQYSTIELVISPDRKDEPRISFERGHLSTDERDTVVKVTVKRTGTDLSKSSSVLVRSKQIDPISAEASKDYMAIVQRVYFTPFVTTQIVHVTILDDTGFPRVEGEERFQLVLRTPINARLGKKRETTVVINDTFSDLPVVQFREESLTAKEDIGLLQVQLTRTGDLTYTSTVRCYTRQDTARAGRDFTERANTDSYLVSFSAGESSKSCEVMITNDLRYEGKESFRLVVASTNEKTRIGRRKDVTITIDDPEDKPLIQLTESHVFVGEPIIHRQRTHVTVMVKRTGDPSISSRVRIYTVDGTAKAGQDYQPVTKILSFAGNLTSHVERVQIMFNKKRQMRRTFTVYITSDMQGSSSLGRRKTVVYIEKTLITSSVTFPLTPKVVSLRDYDDMSEDVGEIPLGYPLVCVTACDPKFPRYSETGSMCLTQNIDNKLTQYRWQISKAMGDPFTDITADTFFTRTNRVTLDSVYLTPGSRVRCVARALTSVGEHGLESTSRPVSAEAKRGLCRARDPSHVGSEPFTASIAFTGARSDGKGNMVHVKVQIPHSDGLIPIISTKMTDIRDTLSPGAMRIAQHKCSNVLDYNEIPTTFGYLKNGLKDAGLTREAEPYQFSSELRGNTTVRFYKNLNLESCVWNFESFFDISELTQFCGGSLTTGQPTKGLTESQLSLRVPLHVSYVYRSRTSATDWLHYDHKMFLRLTLVYDTAVLLKDGVQTPEGSVVSGSLWPTSIKIRDSDKKLIVNFKTKTKFRGIFLPKKEGFNAVAMVISRNHPQLSFSLELVSSQQSYDNPTQRWRFVSDYAAKDYTGSYYIKLIPCVAHIDTPYAEPLVCNPKKPITFNLPIRFQQIPDPVPARFTLSVKFNLMAEKRLWLTGEAVNASEQGLDNAFSRDSKIYGRISLDQGRAEGRGAGSGYQVYTEKVFLCSSDGEYTPSYDPAKKLYGCLEDSHYLIHRMKVLDRNSPDSVANRLGRATFDAKFASDVPEARQLARQSDSDGFAMNSSPLFEVPRTQKWFMHAVYSVSSARTKKQRKPRDADKTTYHKIDIFEPAQPLISGNGAPRKTMRVRRGEKDLEEDRTGTNMKVIRLIYDSVDDAGEVPGSPDKKNNSQSSSKRDHNLVNPLVIGIAVTCGVLLVALVAVWILYKRKGRREHPVQATAQSISEPNARGTAV